MKNYMDLKESLQNSIEEKTNELNSKVKEIEELNEKITNLTKDNEANSDKRVNFLHYFIMFLFLKVQSY